MIVGCGDLTILLVGLGFHCFLLKCKEKLRHSLGRPSRSDFVQLEFTALQTVKETIGVGVNEKAALSSDKNCPFVYINFDFTLVNKVASL